MSKLQKKVYIPLEELDDAIGKQETVVNLARHMLSKTRQQGADSDERIKELESSLFFEEEVLKKLKSVRNRENF